MVIPARDPGPHLGKALASLVAQTHEQWEAVVVDDGSTEDLSWVAAFDPRVRLVRQGGAGIAAARNRAIDETSAELVAFLDADDLWAPSKLERQVEALGGHPEVAMADTAFRRIDADGVDIGGGYSGHHRDYYELLEGCGICVSTVMIRRKVLQQVGGFSPLPVVEDWDLFLRVARVASVDLRVDDVLGWYRVHEGGISQRYLRMFDGAVRMLWSHRRLADADGDLAAVRSADAGIAALRRRASRQALDVARRAWSERRLTMTTGHLAVATAMAPRYMAGRALEQAMKSHGGA